MPEPQLQTRARTTRVAATGGGTITRTTLPSGLRIVSEAMPTVRSASIGVWVPIGSRHESPAVAGASHFLEHLLFKGTTSRTALEIATAMDAVGVVLNATVTAHDVDVERSVVLEEIAMRDDDPADLVHDVFASTLFGDTPLGRPILGSVTSITALRRAQIAGYYRRRYRPRDMVVAVAGNVDHAAAVRRVRSAFAAADGQSGVQTSRL